MKRLHLYVPRKRGEQYIGTVKSVFRKSVDVLAGEDESIEEPYVSVHTLRLPLSMKDTDRLQLREALYNYFRRSCHCEHDCCGCYYGGVRKIHFNGKRDITLTTHYSRNY